MKKKWFTILLSLICTLACALFFIATSNGYGHIDYAYYYVLGDVDLNALIEQPLQNQ